MRVAKELGRRSRGIYVEVGRRIRETRLAHDLTQDELGAHVSLTRTSITNIEAGRQKFLLHTLYEIAEALDVQPAALLPDVPRQASDKTELEQELPSDLSPAEQEWIVAVATALTEPTVPMRKD